MMIMIESRALILSQSRFHPSMHPKNCSHVKMSLGLSGYSLVYQRTHLCTTIAVAAAASNRSVQHGEENNSCSHVRQ